MRNTKLAAKKSDGADGKWLSSHTTEITLIVRARALVTNETIQKYLCTVKVASII